jgi:hypothetical protein
MGYQFCDKKFYSTAFSLHFRSEIVAPSPDGNNLHGVKVLLVEVLY